MWRLLLLLLLASCEEWITTEGVIDGFEPTYLHGKYHYAPTVVVERDGQYIRFRAPYYVEEDVPAGKRCMRCPRFLRKRVVVRYHPSDPTKITAEPPKNLEEDEK